mmetsp:Transcript_89920/g.196811  ORF Transcript_89920/g.196811 Transcript_89920/m.196811 type:complete len:634 (-) Transcript_89920:286-2187(-)
MLSSGLLSSAQLSNMEESSGLVEEAIKMKSLFRAARAEMWQQERYRAEQALEQSIHNARCNSIEAAIMEASVQNESLSRQCRWLLTSLYEGRELQAKAARKVGFFEPGKSNDEGDMSRKEVVPWATLEPTPDNEVHYRLRSLVERLPTTRHYPVRGELRDRLISAGLGDVFQAANSREQVDLQHRERGERGHSCRWSVCTSLRSNLDAVRAIAVQDNLVFTGSEDCVVRAWDLSLMRRAEDETHEFTLDPHASYRGHRRPVLCLACPPTARHFFSGGLEPDILAWRLLTPDEHDPFDASPLGISPTAVRRRLRGHEDAVVSLAVHPFSGEVLGRDILASAGADGQLLLWGCSLPDIEEDLFDSSSDHVFPVAPRPSAALSDEAAALLDCNPTSTEAEASAQFSTSHLKPSGPIEQHPCASVSLATSHDGFAMRAIDLAWTSLGNAPLLAACRADHGAGLLAEGSSSLDGGSGSSFHVAVIDAEVAQVVTLHPVNEALSAIAAMELSNTALLAETRRARLLDLTSGKVVMSFEPQPDIVSAVASDPGGGYQVVTGCHDGFLRVYDLRRCSSGVGVQTSSSAARKPLLQEIFVHHSKYGEAIHDVMYSGSKRLLTAGADSCVSLLLPHGSSARQR